MTIISIYFMLLSYFFFIFCLYLKSGNVLTEHVSKIANISRHIFETSQFSFIFFCVIYFYLNINS